MLWKGVCTNARTWCSLISSKCEHDINWIKNKKNPKKFLNTIYKKFKTKHWNRDGLMFETAKLSLSTTLLLVSSALYSDALSVKHSDSKSVTWESKSENRGKWTSLLILYLFSQALSIGLSHFAQWSESGHRYTENMVNSFLYNKRSILFQKLFRPSVKKTM